MPIYEVITYSWYILTIYDIPNTDDYHMRGDWSFSGQLVCINNIANITFEEILEPQPIIVQHIKFAQVFSDQLYFIVSNLVLMVIYL